MELLLDFFLQKKMIFLLTFNILVGIFIVFLWKKYATKFIGIESSEVQRIHKSKTHIPRMGGFLFLFGLIFLYLVNLGNSIWFTDQLDSILLLMILCNLPLFIISLREDIKFDASPLLRLCGILVSSFLFLFFQPFGLPLIDIPYINNFINLPVISMILFIIAQTGYCNGMNLIDGANGLAGMVILSTLLSIGIVSFIVSDLIIFYIVIVLIGYIIIFLLFNYPWGAIFLGDSGAYLWGSIISSLTIMLYAKNNIPTWGAAVILFYPSMEMIFSFFRKKIQNKSPLEPDPDHLHLKLYFYLERRTKNFKKSNLLIMPILSLVWLTPLVLIPWVFNSINMISISLTVLIFIYFILYILFPKRKINQI